MTSSRTQRTSTSTGVVLALLLLSVLATTNTIHAAEDTTTTMKKKNYTFNFDGCNVDSYYSSLPSDVASWTRYDVHGVIQSTHRNILPYTRINTPGIDDVWMALMDVDIGPVPDTVNLLFTSTYVDAIPFGQRGWVKENIFPTTRRGSIGSEGPDLSDVHNIRPNGVVANTVRGDRFFGECGVLTPNPERCQQPAEGAADDTCVCDTVFTPPANVKGDIARALLYMDLRYDGTDFPGTLNLRLTDCPVQPEHDMAYLSQMLQWHMEDPPDEAEITRNNKICEHWQGNRNPFVDVPDLAQVLHYAPFELPSIGERTIYEACEKIPTQPPQPPQNECDTVIQPGDVYVWVLNSNDPDSIGLYTFVPLPENMTLLLTDNPWNGTQFLEHGGNDGTLKFIVPSGGMPGGQVWGYGDPALEMSDRWEMIQGDFALSSEGEAVFLYCINGAGEQRPLLAFSYGAILAADGKDEYNEKETSFPDQLGEAGLQNIIPHRNNILYNNSAAAISQDVSTSDALSRAVRDPANWIGSDGSRYAVPERPTVQGSSGAGSIRLGVASGIIMTGLIKIFL